MASPTPAAARSADPSNSWQLLVQCLTVECADLTSPFLEAAQRLRDTGCTLFEAVVGAPLERYGPRLTLNPGPDPVQTARALGFAAHPWGPPSWYGLRFDAARQLMIKPYHAMNRLPDGVRRPADLPADCIVELAAQVGGRTEVYLRRVGDGAWSEFAERCAGLVDTPAPVCSPAPRALRGAHCVSLTWTGGALTSVTLYAQDRCLPNDRTIAQIWPVGLAEADRRTYEASVGAVRAMGRPDAKGPHALLGWTVSRTDPGSRAVSLRVWDPPALQVPATGDEG